MIRILTSALLEAAEEELKRQWATAADRRDKYIVGAEANLLTRRVCIFQRATREMLIIRNAIAELELSDAELGKLDRARAAQDGIFDTIGRDIHALTKEAVE